MDHNILSFSYYGSATSTEAVGFGNAYAPQQSPSDRLSAVLHALPDMGVWTEVPLIDLIELAKGGALGSAEVPPNDEV